MRSLTKRFAAALLMAAGAARAEVSYFDGAAGLVHIPSVSVGGLSYVDVVLKHIGDLVFTLQSATLQQPNVGPGVASYDGASAVLSLPDVLVGCTNFAGVELRNIGNFTFTVQAATAKTAPLAAALAITSQPANRNIAQGQAASFSVVAVGSGTLTYQWQRNGVDIPGATAASHTTGPLSFAENGALYAVRVSNGQGSLNSAAATLAVSTGPLSPYVSTEPVSFTAVSLGSTPTLSAVIGGFAPRYQWRRNGIDIAGATSRIVTLPPVTAAEDGAWYSLMACNTIGCVSTLNAQIQLARSGTAVVSQLLAGSAHSLALRSDGSLWGWGQALGGPLSLARHTSSIAHQGHPAMAMCDTTTPFTEVSALASSGMAHTLVLRKDGSVWASGANGRGQLGDGTSAPRAALVPVLASAGVLFQRVRAVGTGLDTSHAVTHDGNAWAWGSNQYQQLGDGSSTDHANPSPVRNANGSVFGGVSAVKAGTIHTLWLKSDGSVWAAGVNSRGQLGDGTLIQRAHPVPVRGVSGVPLAGVRAVAAGATHNLALLADGTALAWGTSSSGALANNGAASTQSLATPVRDASGSVITGIVAVEAGGDTSYLLRADGTVMAAGAVAIGAVTSQFTPALMRDASGAVFGQVRAISSHAGHALAMRNDGTVWGWGTNGSMNLADGTLISRSVPVRVQGLAP